MPDPSRDNLVEALRKAVSRTSMMAEGIDPELDKTLAQIRRTISGEADEQDVRLALKEAEPRLIASDKSKAERAKVQKVKQEAEKKVLKKKVNLRNLNKTWLMIFLELC